jgi:sec-independent protein translocase protein TatA
MIGILTAMPMMFTPGPMELIIILAIILVLFGAKRLPTMARSLGEAIQEFKGVGKRVQQDLADAVDDDNDSTDKTDKTV